jgi:uncharacterized protein (DUF433 family)
MNQSDQQGYLLVLNEVVSLLKEGLSYEAIKLQHPQLSVDDIKACHEIGLQRLNRESVSQPVYCRLDTRKKSNH